MSAFAFGSAGRRRALAWSALAVLHLGVALFFLADRASGTAAATTGFPFDDSRIHLVYAHSLARFDGFACNPGVPEASTLCDCPGQQELLVLRADPALVAGLAGEQ